MNEFERPSGSRFRLHRRIPVSAVDALEAVVCDLQGIVRRPAESVDSDRLCLAVGVVEIRHGGPHGGATCLIPIRVECP